MTAETWANSAGSPVLEPPELWTSRLPGNFSWAVIGVAAGELSIEPVAIIDFSFDTSHRGAARWRPGEDICE